MSLRSLQKSWDRLGATDPFWAILTDPAKKNNGWDRAEFFETGVSEVDNILSWVERVHPLPAKQIALDFGCGVGRLSQRLADHFKEVRGVDISPSMIELARELNSKGDRCQYYLNAGQNLERFADNSVDFIYSSITLQHIRPQFTKAYLAEFARVLRPGGVLVFQLPSRMLQGTMHGLRQLIYKLYYGVFMPVFHPGSAVIEMHAIEQEEVKDHLARCQMRVLDVVRDHSAGPVWESFRYLATKA